MRKARQAHQASLTSLIPSLMYRMEISQCLHPLRRGVVRAEERAWPVSREGDLARHATTHL